MVARPVRGAQKGCPKGHRSQQPIVFQARGNRVRAYILTNRKRREERKKRAGCALAKCQIRQKVDATKKISAPPNYDGTPHVFHFKSIRLQSP